MKYISLDDLYSIVGIYGLRRDIRAKAAILNASIDGKVIHWVPIEEDVPEMDAECLVLVDMRTEFGLVTESVEKASFVRGVGWILHTDIGATEFTVKKWAAMPKA